MELRVEVPWNVNDDDALVAPEQKKRFQDGSALVVEQIVIPMALHELGNQNSNLLIRILSLGFEDVVHNRAEN